MSAVADIAPGGAAAARSHPARTGHADDHLRRAAAAQRGPRMFNTGPGHDRLSSIGRRPDCPFLSATSASSPRPARRSLSAVGLTQGDFAGDIYAAAYLQLLHDPPNVALHGATGDQHLDGDLRVGPSLAHRCRHVPFGLRQRVPPDERAAVR